MVEDLARRGLRVRPHHHQHPLLRFGQHDVVCRHAQLAAADPVDIDIEPPAAAMRQLAGRARQPCRSQVLDRGDTVQLVEPQARLAEQLLQERVPDLDRGTALGRPLVHLHRGKGRAMDAVPTGIGPHQEHDVAGAVRDGTTQAVVRHQADAHGIDDRVVGIARVEIDFAANRRTPKAVAVAADAGDHALEQVAAVA